MDTDAEAVALSDENIPEAMEASPPKPSGKQGGGPPAVSAEELKEFGGKWQPLAQANLSANADYYFKSYAHVAIHEEMIKDQSRTGAYYQAIVRNAHAFEGKVVLDVGSGSGILSLFAAKAGAKHVYGIECSEIIEVARRAVKDNNLSDKITFIKGKAEEIELPVKKVDIIISEWMGYFLLYESMLDTVLDMRDKYLAPGGLIFPDKAILKMAAIEDADYKEQKINFWENVYGFDFSCVKECVMEEPIVDNVDSRAVVTNAWTINTFDLYTVKKSDLDFTRPYRLDVTRKDFIHALVVWFDVEFTACHKVVKLSTSPFAQVTHWKQTVFYIEDILIGHKGDCITGLIAVKKNEQNFRDLDVKLSYQFNGEHARRGLHYYRIR